MIQNNLRIKPHGRSVVTYESTSMEIFMDAETRSGRLSNLYSVSRSKGYATELLKIICEWADENNVYLWLVAKPYGSPRQTLDQDRLIRFYEKFGFHKRPSASRYEMGREPL